MPKLETIRPLGLSTPTSASSSRLALGRVGKRDSETDGDVADAGLVEPGAAASCSSARAADRHDMLVGDRQRMAGQRHFQPRERPPAAADQVEGPARRRAVEAGAGAPPWRPSSRRSLAFRGERVEPEHAERQRGAAPTLAAGNLDQLQAAAAEIADDAVGVGDGGKHALPRPLAFLLAGEDARIEAEPADRGRGRRRRSRPRGPRRWRRRGSAPRPSARSAGGSGRSAASARAPAPPRRSRRASRPRPASTFSLKMTEGMRVAPE